MQQPDSDRQTIPPANAQRVPLWVPGILCFLVLMFDMVTPRGLAAGIAYIPLVFCSLWFTRPRAVFIFTAFVTALTIIGFFLSPQGRTENWIVVTNRLLTIAALWFIATLVYLRRKSEGRRQSSDNKLQAVLDNVNDGIITINTRGIVESYNPACARIFGYRADEVIGQNIKMLMPEPYHGEHDGYLDNYKRTGKAKIIGIGREVSGRRKDGSVFPMDLSVSVFQLDGVRHFSGIVRDISERKEAEKLHEQLRQAQKMESLGHLTGGIAHDFNNLLAIILGNLDFLSERIKASDPLRRFIAPSIAAAEHGANLTKQLLAFGRKQALQPRVTSLNELLQQLTTLVQRTLGERVEVILVLDPKAWQVNVDASQLQNAFINLAVNARDAMPDGGKLIFETKNVTLDSEYARVNTEVTPGDYVVIAVSDTGKGMTQEVMDKAFEPFFTTKELGKGSGLGLSMVYGFVKQSKGHLKLYSELGYGTTIKIYLPRAMGAAGRAEPAAPSPPVAKHQAKTVLVVEDNKEVLALTVAMVEDLGYTALQAETGEEALSLLEGRHDVQLLLTDVMLPGTLNGPVLAQRAVSLYPSLKVLFNSGYAEHAIMQSGILEEGVHLIGKPFRKQQLGEKIEEVLKS
jgi:PAS domain S-box-containing protein